jgi:3-deoxy-7-phosphoheptulonate synthase
MIIVMSPHAADEEILAVEASIAALELSAHVSRGAERTIVGVIGAPDDKEALRAQFVQLDGVEQVILISRAYKLVSREAKPEPTVVRVREGVTFGGEVLALAAGPCSIESKEQVLLTAERSSRARRPTPSRAWDNRDSSSCARPPTGTVWPW